VARVIVVDANVMIAVLDPQDSHFDRARRFFVANASERLAAHRLTMAEALVLAANGGREVAAAAAISALGVGRFDEPDDPIEVARLRASTGLRMPDCCVLYAAIRERAKLATFDAQLARAASGLGVPVLGVEQ
jgi:predicted nucleic acid-binding protein